MNAIIPLIKCKDMKESISFYVNILDFQLQGTWPETGSPSFSILIREGAEIYLSTYPGDGTFGNVVSIIVDNVDELFNKLIAKGLHTTYKKESPVHQHPVNQTWGNREFYVDGPDGNTLRYITRLKT